MIPLNRLHATPHDSTTAAAIKPCAVASVLRTLLAGFLILRCVIDTNSLPDSFAFLYNRISLLDVIYMCPMDLVIVAIGVLIVSLRALSMFQLKKHFHYAVDLRCNIQTFLLFLVTAVSIVHAVVMFFLVRKYWTARLSIVIQLLHFFPSASVVMDVILQGLYLVCRCNAGGRQRSASEQSLARILDSSNWVFIVYSVTMLVVVCHRSDPFVIPEAVVILTELSARTYVVFVLKEEFDLRNSVSTTLSVLSGWMLFTCMSFVMGIWSDLFSESRIASFHTIDTGMRIVVLLIFTGILVNVLFILYKALFWFWPRGNVGLQHENNQPNQPPVQLRTPTEATEFDPAVSFLVMYSDLHPLILNISSPHIETTLRQPANEEIVPTFSKCNQCLVAAQSEPDPTASLVMNSDQPRNTYRNTVPTESFLDPPSRPLMEDVLRPF